MLGEAGYGSGLTLIAAVRDIGIHLDVMRSVGADLEKCGITLVVKTYSQAEYYGSLLTDPAKARAGVWDIAEPGWTPDWYGNNGRAMARPLFQTDGSAGTTNYGCYSDATVDRLIDRALEEPDPGPAEDLWHQVDVRVMQDVPILPLLAFACRSCAGRAAASGWGTASPRFTRWLTSPA